jgi:hypothetical protein
VSVLSLSFFFPFILYFTHSCIYLSYLSCLIIFDALTQSLGGLLARLGALPVSLVLACVFF